jgi:16S rRNA (uracil1498-N3)-methyltransferase
LTLSQALAVEKVESEAIKLRWVLSLSSGTQNLKDALKAFHSDAAGSPLEITLLSGPEGGLSPAEEAQALVAGFVPVSLGDRVLRAETAPVAVLSILGALT